jgi:hypothetical protein
MLIDPEVDVNHLEVNAVSGDVTQLKTKIDINDAHQFLGHLSLKGTKEVAETLSWQLTLEAKRCKDCDIGKGRQKNVTKSSKHVVSNKVGERIFLDVAAVFKNKDSDALVDSNRKRYWRILVDLNSRSRISLFLNME